MGYSLKVVVLMGGPSAEHDISLKSGHGIVEALSRRGWTVEPIVIPRSLTVDRAKDAAHRTLRDAGADVAFIAIHGTFGEDGTIQDVCEQLHVPYVGSDVAASRIGMDKVASRKRFVEAGLFVPRWQLVDGAQGASAASSMRYPLMVKPIGQGSSLGVSLVPTSSELPAALAAAAPYGSQVLIEEFVAGRELTVGILGDEPLPVIEIRPKAQPFFNYTAKYIAGMTDYLVPAPLSDAVARRVQQAGLAAHHALGCRHLSRADLILSHDHVPVILEVNTIPGFTPTSLLPKAAACIQLSYDELCERLVLMAVASPAAAASHR